MATHDEVILKAASGTPELPVTPSLWPLLQMSARYSCAEIQAMQESVMKIRKQHGHDQAIAIAAHHWQKKCVQPAPIHDSIPPRTVISSPVERLLHLQVMAEVEQIIGTQTRGAPTAVTIPCARCGTLFTPGRSRHAGRTTIYARQCQRCNDGRTYLPSWRHEPLCAHPDCLTIYEPKLLGQDRYCSDHSRMAAKRARDRDSTAKHRRFVFTVTPGTTLTVGPLEITGSLMATDLHALTWLAGLAAQGAVIATQAGESPAVRTALEPLTS